MNKYLFILIILITSCKPKNSFDREDYLFRYLKEVQNIQLNNEKQFVFIISNNACNCSGDPNEILGDNFVKNKFSKIIIMGKNDTALVYSLTKKINHQKIVFDKDGKLADYGLSNATHFLFEIENQKIIYWNYMSNATKDEIVKKYKNNN